jgi:hypothetical protein
LTEQRNNGYNQSLDATVFFDGVQLLDRFTPTLLTITLENP